MIDKNYLLPMLVISFTLLTLAACRSVQNYRNEAEPFFSGSYATPSPIFDGEIKVITWNIRFSEKIEPAITELTTIPELQNVDILLLQEMDQTGVDRIARALAYNYIYFPASVHTHHHKNFGNAILSPWPITSPFKLILPYQNPKNNQIRIATRGVVTVASREILVYSVHTETVWLGEEKRQAQIETLLNDIAPKYERVIVGGDFNTFVADSIVQLEGQFEQDGFTRVSTNAGITFEYGDFGFALDHLFARGLAEAASGVWPDTEASDHYPLWVELTFN